MPKADLTDDMKKIIAKKYDNAEPKMSTADLCEWAAKELGKPVSAAVCNAIKRTSKRYKERVYLRLVLCFTLGVEFFWNCLYRE